MLNGEKKWMDKWQEVRKGGRLKFALVKALFTAGIISILAFLFVYLANYQLSTSKESFIVILFIVMFTYKFIRHYFLEWPKNEKRYLEGN